MTEKKYVHSVIISKKLD